MVLATIARLRYVNTKSHVHAEFQDRDFIVQWSMYAQKRTYQSYEHSSKCFIGLGVVNLLENPVALQIMMLAGPE